MLSQSARYFIPEPSYWPIYGSAALLAMASGAASWFNGWAPGKFVVLAGVAIFIYMLVGWFHTVAHESESGRYNRQVDVSFRWGMSWFIFSEVMFFAAFFGALFYMRVLSVPWLGDLEHKLIWPEFNPAWPAAGPGLTDVFTPMAAWGIPALNTLLLLSSGVTVTWAHWGLLRNNRRQLIWGLVFTIALGLTFLGFQIYEYGHAYSDLNLKLTTGAYGATFFMLTGFHGFHVTIGCIMLTTILGRCLAGHFRSDHHFGFEGVAWYWHFVDVVWLLLFVLVYWL
jgi:cytochrome c oxidase subunit III